MLTFTKQRIAQHTARFAQQFILLLACTGLATGGSISAALASEPTPLASPLPQMHVYHRESCGCCRAWMKYLRHHGLDVTETLVESTDAVQAELGVPVKYSSCHTATIDGYVIEGHVAFEDIERLLEERPKGAVGLAVPGMPAGSPGMEVAPDRAEPYETLLIFRTGKATPFSSSEAKLDAAETSMPATND